MESAKLNEQADNAFAGWVGKELLLMLASNEHKYLIQNQYVIDTLKTLAGHSKEMLSSLVNFASLHPERDILALAVELAPREKKVFRILLKKAKTDRFETESLLKNMILDKTTESAILFEVAESSILTDATRQATSLLIQRKMHGRRMLNLLIKDEGSMETFTALRAMGAEAKPAVKVFLPYFKTKLNVSNYSLLVAILKDIHVDDRDLKNGYLIASQSDDKVVAQLASKALAELEGKKKRRPAGL